MSVVLVTHDLGVVAGTCDRVAVMYAGSMVETGPAETISARPAHAYTLGLLRSLPDAAAVRHRLLGIPGHPPDPAHLPPGCRFAPRCGFAIPDCSAAVPGVRGAGAHAHRMYPRRYGARADGPGGMTALLRADDLSRASRSGAGCAPPCAASGPACARSPA